MSESQKRLKEQNRLNALLKLKVLDSPFETVFDTITRIASDTADAPIALISLTDSSRHWFKANVGLEGVKEAPRENSFCDCTIESDGSFEVCDASKDDRFLNHPMVKGDPNIRFYFGAPIKMPMGEIIGTICVIDTKPNQMNQQQRKTLEGLAKLISQLLILREINLKNSDLECG